MGSGSGNEALRAFANLPVSSDEAIEKMVASLEMKETADFDIRNLLQLLGHSAKMSLWYKKSSKTSVEQSFFVGCHCNTLVNSMT
jgi:hypothetical protein